MRTPALLLTLSVPLLFSACALRAADESPRARLSVRTAAQTPADTNPDGTDATAPVPPATPDGTVPPVSTPEAPITGNVRWASPRSGTVLFRPKTVTLDWVSTYPPGCTYSVTLSRDKKTFHTVIADRITETHTEWKLPELPKTNVWLRVKAMDSAGRKLGEDVILVHLLPANAIIVSKSNQVLWAFENGKLHQRYLVSTGEGGYDTRAGWFSVYIRQSLHHSKLYDVDMPYALFFSGGQAIHASTALRRLGSPASHGCVRLPRRHAHALFDESSVGRPVIVTRWGQDMSYLDAFRATHTARKPAKARTRTAASKATNKTTTTASKAPAMPRNTASKAPAKPGTVPGTSAAPAIPVSTHFAGR